MRRAGALALAAQAQQAERRNPPALLVGALTPRESNQLNCPAPSADSAPPSGLNPTDD